MLDMQQPLSIDVWKRIKMNAIMKINQLIETDRNECKKIIDYAIRVLINEFDHKTTLNFMKKKKIGYILRLQCSKHSRGCKCCWYVVIDINRNVLTLKCNQRCEHFLSDEFKSKYIS